MKLVMFSIKITAYRHLQVFEHESKNVVNIFKKHSGVVRSAEFYLLFSSSSFILLNHLSIPSKHIYIFYFLLILISIIQSKG